MPNVNPYTGQQRGTHYMHPGTRDSQKSKLYAAERTAFGAAIERAAGKLRDLAACQRLVDSWMRAAWFSRRWGVKAIDVEHNGGKGGSRGGGWRIQVSTYHRNPYILAHEMAHCLAPHGVGHGPAYARTYLELVRYAIGREAYDALKAAFKQHRVKVAPKRVKLDAHGVVGVRTRRGNPAALAAWRAKMDAVRIDTPAEAALLAAAITHDLRQHDIALTLAYS